MPGQNSYEAREETKQRAHSNAVRELADSRSKLKDAITLAESEGVPPYRTLVNPYPPTDAGLNGGMRTPQWGETLRLCHATALEFYSEVEPYKHHHPKLWEEELITVNFPQVNGTVTEERRHQNPDIEKSHIEYREMPLTLDSLSKWRCQEILLSCQYKKKFEGKQTRSRREKILLPIAACDSIYRQLNKVLERLSLLAEIREEGAADTDPGQPDDIDVWGEEVDNE